MRLSDILAFFVLVAIFLFSTTVVEPRTPGSSANLILIETPKEKRFFKAGEDRLVTVESNLGEMTVEIGSDFVRVVNSPCKDKYCVRQGKIRNPGESIICLPGRVKISIEGQAFTDSVNR